jgi:gliding motility-associated-like protein
MNKFKLVLIFLLAACANAFATHNRAGQITYRFIGDWQHAVYRYEITITTFTKTSSYQADRPQLDSVYLGDTSIPTVFVRDTFIDMPNDIRKNIYTEEHTYNGNGHYLIHFTDPNRNANVRNIPNSVAVPFYLETYLEINPFIGPNNSIWTTYDPIDQGCINRIYIHNPFAHDPDGDSLSYELIECKGAGGIPIVGYTYPSASHSFTLDQDGFLTWDSPTMTGEYNAAFLIKEWRNGTMIGYVERDMQILIGNCDNYPPVIQVINDTCVLAGQTLRFNVFAYDLIDHNNVKLSETGGVFDANLVPDPATLTDSTINNDSIVSKFEWNTKCHHVRRQPYLAGFRAVDLPPPPTTSLVDLKGTYIHVIPPGPDTLYAVPNGSGIELTWLMPFCGNIHHFNIYRKAGPFNGTIDCPCSNGVPSSTGYSLIDTVGGNDTTYVDDNNGQGLTIGIQYCYMITAVYDVSASDPGGVESCASPQACASLKKDAPVITNADVTTTSTTNGAVYVAWSKPTELDTLTYPPPYEYRVFSSPDFTGGNFSQNPIITFPDLNDTTYIDTLIDTQTHPWSYKVELYYTDTTVIPHVFKFKGRTATASTVFLSIAPTDNRLNLSWEEHVPWNNSSYDVFRLNSFGTFDSIATVTAQAFSDTGLVNGTQYCYYVRSIGSYSFSGFVDPIVNKSQRTCSVPFDNVHPCAPDLTVIPDCNENLNALTWTNPNNSCADDVLKYYIYFGSDSSGNFELIDSTTSATDTTFQHTGLSQISGCYKITAVDSVGNETLDPFVVCVDTCRQYVLPSVFSPNGDGKNDFFHPCDSTTSDDFQQTNCPPYKNVKSVDMKIFNRWGALVFETKDKDINWDGKNKYTKGDCSEGVYYYTCKVFFYSVKGEQTSQLHGTIQLIRPAK